jgi:HAE1 family hydrophobic/amphiphilic exporter-1
MKGPSGIFFKQFSLTMAVSIVLSGVVALTLTPALCVLLLKPREDGHRQNFLTSFFGAFNRWYAVFETKYAHLVRSLLNRRLITYAILLSVIAFSGLFSRLLPVGFIPNEDQGTFYISVTTPSGSTLERTKVVVDAISRVALTNPAIKSVSTLAGTNVLSDGTGATFGTCLVNLKNWSDRNVTVREVIDDVHQKVSSIKDARIELFPPPAVPGYGNASGFELRLLDKTGSGNYKQLELVTNQFIKDLKSNPEIKSAFTIYDASFPQYTLNLDLDKAAQKGVTVAQAMETLKTYIGSQYASNFIRFGQMYKVMVQALPEYRAIPDDVLKLSVKNAAGDLVPFSAFVSLEKTFGLEQITRYNMYPSAELNGEPAEGFSSGTVLKTIQEVANNKLPAGFDIDWAGISRDEIASGNQSLVIFVICLVFVYLILAGQYESFVLPLPVILSLPTGALGAFFFLYLMGLENNIYAQIAMIMLIGLLGKNAILIVEFAMAKVKEGKSLADGVTLAATERLRPILMTSFAFVVGLVPLMFASGAGEVGNRTIGSAGAGGMLLGTLLGVILVPGLFIVFAKKVKH